MTNHPTRPYHQEASQSERQRILQNDRRANTFAGRTSSDLDLENTGRHAKLNTVIGLDAIEYPRLPTSSPFANDPVPPEEPLGYDINEAPIVGEEFEIHRSLAGDSDTSGDDPSSAGGATLHPSASSDVERPGQNPTQRKRRGL